jgi:hypothetical protein
MKTRPLSRRTLLRGSLAGLGLAMAVPPLEAMLSSRGVFADGHGADRFFVLFFWGGGLPWHDGHGALQAGHPDLWTPSQVGPGYAPTELLAPLAAHQVSVVTGLEPATEIPASPPGQGDGHMRGFMVAMTGDRPRSEGFDHPPHILTALRPTLDQVVARHPAFYRFPVQYRSLEVGVSEARFHPYGHWNAVSYNGPDSMNEPIMRPTALFDRLFGIPQDTAELADRSRALDAVLDDARRLQARLGAADRQRLEAHLQHVSEIQRRLAAGATCEAPDRPSDGGGFIARTRVMGDLLALAVSCGQTSVACVQLTTPATTHVFSNVGAGQELHKTLHDGLWEQTRAVTRHQMEAFASFLDAFAAVTLPAGGTLLDQGLVYGTSEYGEGYKHSPREHPIVLAGGAGGALARGVHVRQAGGNISRAQLTALKALGLPFDSFGWNGGETREPFPELLR